MLKIEKFQIKKDGYTVSYSTFLESFRFTTEDEPRIELITAARDLVGKAQIHFGFDGIPASFYTIEISHGEEPGSKLVLRVPTKDGNYARIECPKVDQNEVIDFVKGVAVDCSQNDYIYAEQKLVSELEIYIKGKRQQMALPFDESAEEDGPVTNGRMEQAVADRIIGFGGHR